MFGRLLGTSCLHWIRLIRCGTQIIPRFLQEELGITSKPVDEYLYSLIPKRHPVLSRLESEARREGWPIIGPLGGALLHFLAKSVRAQHVLELGTAIGYSAIIWGRAVQEFDGTVVTVEAERKTAERARKNIGEAGLSKRIRVVHSDAVTYVSQLKEKFDIVFVDVDKESYPILLSDCLRVLNSGGLLVADNCLLGGSVVENRSDRVVREVRLFNERVAGHGELEGLIVPLRDGIYVGRKK